MLSEINKRIEELSAEGDHIQGELDELDSKLNQVESKIADLYVQRAAAIVLNKLIAQHLESPTPEIRSEIEKARIALQRITASEVTVALPGDRVFRVHPNIKAPLRMLSALSIGAAEAGYDGYYTGGTLTAEDRRELISPYITTTAHCTNCGCEWIEVRPLVMDVTHVMCSTCSKWTGTDSAPRWLTKKLVSRMANE